MNVYVKNSKIARPSWCQGLVTVARDESNNTVCAMIYHRQTSTSRRVWAGGNRWDLWAIVPRDGYVVTTDVPTEILGRYNGADVGFHIAKEAKPAMRLPNGFYLPPEYEVVAIEYHSQMPDEDDVRTALSHLVFHQPGGPESHEEILDPIKVLHEERVSFYAFDHPQEYRTIMSLPERAERYYDYRCMLADIASVAMRWNWMDLESRHPQDLFVTLDGQTRYERWELMWMDVDMFGELPDGTRVVREYKDIMSEYADIAPPPTADLLWERRSERDVALTPEGWTADTWRSLTQTIRLCGVCGKREVRHRAYYAVQDNRMDDALMSVDVCGHDDCHTPTEHPRSAGSTIVERVRIDHWSCDHQIVTQGMLTS